MALSVYISIVPAQGSVTDKWGGMGGIRAAKSFSDTKRPTEAQNCPLDFLWKLETAVSPVGGDQENEADGGRGGAASFELHIISLCLCHKADMTNGKWCYNFWTDEAKSEQTVRHDDPMTL